MKHKLHGIRATLWCLLVAVAVGSILAIGVLQTGLIRPYYRNMKVNTIKAVSETYERELLSEKGADTESVKRALQETVNNSICVVIYNSSGTKVYSADSIGSGCLFNAAAMTESGISVNDASRMMALVDEVGGEYSENISNERTGQDMILYGKKIHETLGTYYLFLNSPLEPVDSIISLFSRQYILFAVFLTVLVSLMAYYVSGKLADPLQKMQKQAQKLSEADYSVHFEGGSFKETHDLAVTLNDTAKRLEKVDELRRDLIANVSHDIRTPLTNIRAYAEMIRDISGDNPTKRAKHIEVIIREAEFMNNLVNDMSELSRMQSGNYEMNMSNFDLAERIREIILVDRPLAEHAGETVVQDIPDSLFIYADSIKLGQVIHNFLTNAIKHSHEGGKIWISAKMLDDEETVRVEVRDEGDGISEEELPGIWDRYQKSSRTFYRNQKSTGLGLAIVKAILDSHHAEYGVDTKEGEGSLFWFEMRNTHEG